MAKARQGNNPKRRIAPYDCLDRQMRQALADRLAYTGSSHHTRRPADYGLHPPINPRPWKSICDGRRIIEKREAAELFRAGIMNGMFSTPLGDGSPKYVWAVDAEDEVYEAKADSFGYHGYRLEEEDEFRRYVLREWKQRCQAN